MPQASKDSAFIQIFAPLSVPLCRSDRSFTVSFDNDTRFRAVAVNKKKSLRCVNDVLHTWGCNTTQVKDKPGIGLSVKISNSMSMTTIQNLKKFSLTFTSISCFFANCSKKYQKTGNAKQALTSLQKIRKALLETSTGTLFLVRVDTIPRLALNEAYGLKDDGLLFRRKAESVTPEPSITQHEEKTPEAPDLAEPQPPTQQQIKAQTKALRRHVNGVLKDPSLSVGRKVEDAVALIDEAPHFIREERSIALLGQQVVRRILDIYELREHKSQYRVSTFQPSELMQSFVLDRIHQMLPSLQDSLTNVIEPFSIFSFVTLQHPKDWHAVTVLLLDKYIDFSSLAPKNLINFFEHLIVPMTSLSTNYGKFPDFAHCPIFYLIDMFWSKTGNFNRFSPQQHLMIIPFLFNTYCRCSFDSHVEHHAFENYNKYLTFLNDLKQNNAHPDIELALEHLKHLIYGNDNGEIIQLHTFSKRSTINALKGLLKSSEEKHTDLSQKINTFLTIAIRQAMNCIRAKKFDLASQLFKAITQHSLSTVHQENVAAGKTHLFSSITDACMEYLDKSHNYYIDKTQQLPVSLGAIAFVLDMLSDHSISTLRILKSRAFRAILAITPFIGVVDKNYNRSLIQKFLAFIPSFIKKNIIDDVQSPCTSQAQVYLFNLAHYVLKCENQSEVFKQKFFQKIIPMLPKPNELKELHKDLSNARTQLCSEVLHGRYDSSAAAKLIKTHLFNDCDTVTNPQVK